MIQCGCKPTATTCCAVLRATVDSGDLCRANFLLKHFTVNESTSSPKASLYSVVLHGLARVGDFAGVHALQSSFLAAGGVPTADTFEAIIEGLLVSRNETQAISWAQEMMKAGFVPSAECY